MTTKQWLARGQGAEQEISRLGETREAVQARLTSAVGTFREGHNESPDPHKFDHLIELDDEIRRQCDNLAKASAEITAAIYKLPDRRYREILLLRYVTGETWDDIAADLCYSRRHVTKLHDAAIKAIEKICEEDAAKIRRTSRRTAHTAQ